MMATLEALRDALDAIAAVNSCKIGIEANVSPSDYPLIRVVPSKIQNSAVISRRRIECLVYFGMDTSEAENGLEGVYADLFELEDSILTVIDQAGGYYIETITDEDRLDTYKMMAIRCEVEG